MASVDTNECMPLGAFGSAALCGLPVLGLMMGAPPSAGSDSTAPTVSEVSPAAGTRLHRTQSVSFKLSDETGLLFTAVQVDQGGQREPVFDGVAFVAPYIGSSRNVISSKVVVFTVTRTGGWVSPPVFYAFAVDAGGNLNS